MDGGAADEGRGARPAAGPRSDDAGGADRTTPAVPAADGDGSAPAGEGGARPDPSAAPAKAEAGYEAGAAEGGGVPPLRRPAASSQRAEEVPARLGPPHRPRAPSPEPTRHSGHAGHRGGQGPRQGGALPNRSAQLHADEGLMQPPALRLQRQTEAAGPATAAAARPPHAVPRWSPPQPPPPLEPPPWATVPDRPLVPERRRSRGLFFTLFVILPTLIGVAFAYGIAADLYVSETRFFVRGQKPPAPPSLLSGLLGQVGLAPSHEEAFSVRDFVHSHDAVAGLLQRLDLRALYRRPEADFVNRLEADASMERLVRYHRDMVEVRHDTASGLTTMRVFAWRAEDAKAIAEALLEQSEALVNRFSERAIEDSLRLARAEVAAAEARVAEVRARLTEFRDRARELDPGQAGAAVLALVAALEGQLAQVRAEISEASAFMRPDNPRLVSLRARAAAIEEQIARERGRLTGASGALAPVIAEYEQLQLAREFADRALASALTSLEQARIEAQRQQIYLVRVVEPQLAEEALYPRRWLIVLGTAAGSLLLYGIGVLVVAGIRDHIT